MVTKTTNTQSIQASEFKAKCLALMDDDTPFGLHPTLEIRGDVIAPLEDDAWEVME